MTGRLWAIVAAAGAVALVVGLGIGMAIGDGGHGPGDGPHDGSGPAMGEGMGPGMAFEDRMGERRFLQMMVPHHRSAVAMAELALERARRPEVRRLAEGIVASQESEIEQMRAWSEEWFGARLREDTAGPHGAMEMGDLEATAAGDFDRAFLAAMIPHHGSALMMADAALRADPRGELERLTREIIAAQAEEIGQMQRWRQTWYPPLG